eukprot:gene6852-9383_t
MNSTSVGSSVMLSKSTSNFVLSNYGNSSSDDLYKIYKTIFFILNQPLNQSLNSTNGYTISVEQLTHKITLQLSSLQDYNGGVIIDGQLKPIQWMLQDACNTFLHNNLALAYKLFKDVEMKSVELFQNTSRFKLKCILLRIVLLCCVMIENHLSSVSTESVPSNKTNLSNIANPMLNASGFKQTGSNNDGINPSNNNQSQSGTVRNMSWKKPYVPASSSAQIILQSMKNPSDNYIMMQDFPPNEVKKTNSTNDVQPSEIAPPTANYGSYKPPSPPPVNESIKKLTPTKGSVNEDYALFSDDGVNIRSSNSTTNVIFKKTEEARASNTSNSSTESNSHSNSRQSNKSNTSNNFSPIFSKLKTMFHYLIHSTEANLTISKQFESVSLLNTLYLGLKYLPLVMGKYSFDKRYFILVELADIRSLIFEYSGLKGEILDSKYEPVDFLEINPVALVGHTDAIRTIIIEDMKLFSGSKDGTIRIWDTRLLTEIGCIETGNEGWVTSLAVHQNSLFCVEQGKRVITVWDVSTLEEITSLSGHTGSVHVLLVDGDRLYSGAGDNTIRIWDVSTFNEVCCLTPEGNSNQYVTSLAINKHNRLFAGCFDGTIRVWDLEKKTEFPDPLIGHIDTVNTLIVSDKYNYLISGGNDSMIRIWDLFKYSELRCLSSHKYGVTSLIIVEDRLFSGCSSWDHRIKVWDMSSFNEIKSLEGHDAAAVTFACKGSRFFSGSRDNTIHARLI